MATNSPNRVRQISRILSILLIVIICLLGWLLLPISVKRFFTSPIVLFVIVAFSIIPLVWLLENWRKVVNPIVQMVYSLLTYQQRREYFSPKVSIEGYGAKHGLTVVEAAVVMQKPFDQILSLILESSLEKGAFRFSQPGMLLFEIPQLFPEGLTSYERDFARACRETVHEKRARKLVACFVNLVKSVKVKMRGYDLTETGKFYTQNVDTEISSITDWRIAPVVTELAGNLEQFTLQVTSRTNPISAAPVFKEIPEYMKIKSQGGNYGRGWSGGHGGSGCAGGGGCACACAGCACACAGGGR